MRLVSFLLATAVVLAGCGGNAGPDAVTSAKRQAAAGDAGPVGAPATRTSRLDLAACLAEDIGADAAQTSRCPTFALLSLDYLASQCSVNGGSLKARQPSESWSLDVDGDASAEVLVDLAANFECEGAPGALGCGSGGCPYLLYKKRGDGWAEIGAINADDAPAIEVLPAPEGSFATLRGGCLGQQPCSERTHYEWNGSGYERRWVDFKGHAVDVAAGTLMKLTKDSAVYDAPGGRKAQLLDEYPVGTSMLVIGTAREGPYTFVSPCNACRRGFVETALLAK